MGRNTPKLHKNKFVVIACWFCLHACGESPTSQLNEEFPAIRPGPHGMEFSFIPRGHFEMGSPKGEGGRNADETLHWVKLSKDYWMQTTELTRGQWYAVMGNYPKGCGPVIDRPEFPMTCVTWNEVEKFVVTLNDQTKKDGYEYRLPTEAEWEYAARAYTQTPYSIKGLFREFGWYGDTSGGNLHPVAQLKANNFGLYDVHGNAVEWVFDLYGNYSKADTYEKALQNPKGPGPGESDIRLVRGGDHYSREIECRSASRRLEVKSAPGISLGFRLVRND